MSVSKEIIEAMEMIASPERAASSMRFFKTGTGQYGAGDTFIGISLPDQRKIANRFYKEASLKDIQNLLQNKVHEHRLTALLMLVAQFKKAKSEEAKKSIIDTYITNLSSVNNWDLVDTSAYSLLGAYLIDKPKTLLYQFGNSGDLWKQRIAIIATYYFIKQKQFDDTLAIAKILLHHPHDLIHKAVGWMLRELGNRDPELEIEFLKKHYHQMPRTALRYAIEKFPQDLKIQFMQGTIAP